MEARTKATDGVPSAQILDHDTTTGEELDALLIEVGQKVGSRRRQCDLTQEQLAQRAGCSTNTVIAVENGKRNVTVRSLVVIASALGVHFAELFPAISPPTAQAEDDKSAKLTANLAAAGALIDGLYELISEYEGQIRPVAPLNLRRGELYQRRRIKR